MVMASALSEAELIVESHCNAIKFDHKPKSFASLRSFFAHVIEFAVE